MKTLIATALIAATALSGPAAAEWSRQDRNRLIVGAAILGLLALGSQGGRATPAPAPQPVYQPTANYLPGGCMTQYTVSTGPLRFLNGSCLEQTYAGAAQLPLDCALTLRINGRYESGYDAACLNVYGYQLSSY